jgi:hypothetical protein
MSSIPLALSLSVPLIFSGILHMVIVKADLLSSLKKPIHLRVFGANKTWRGMLAVPILTVLGFLIARPLYPFSELGYSSLIEVGFGVGLAYVLAELPNSAFKRRLGIEPGKLPKNRRAAFVLLDQSDSVIGCCLAYAWLMPELPITALVWCGVISPAIHLALNLALYFAGLRKNPV